MRTPLLLAAGIAGLTLAVPPADAALWQEALDLGRVTDPLEANARVALDPNGEASVAWSSGEVIRLRDVSPAGRSGRVVRARGYGLEAVARDGSGRALLAVTGSTGRPQLEAASALIRRGDTFVRRTLGTGSSAEVELAEGDARGFTLAISTFRRTGRDDDASALRRVRIAGDGRTTVGTAIRGLGDGGELALDMRDWTRDADGTPIGLVTVAVPGDPDALVQPSSGSESALVRLEDTPTVTRLGERAVGTGVLDRSTGPLVAAGLEVDTLGDAGARGRVRTSVGDETALRTSRLVPGVPRRRALEVDVAALPDGGAVVTWLQKVDTGGFSRLGRPHWARLAPDGIVVAQGQLDDRNASDLRVVRVGRGAVALWIGQDADTSRFRAARLGGRRPLPLSAPDGSPVGRFNARTSQQVVSAGNRVAVAFVDARTKQARVAIRRVPGM